MNLKLFIISHDIVFSELLLVTGVTCKIAQTICISDVHIFVFSEVGCVYVICAAVKTVNDVYFTMKLFVIVMFAVLYIIHVKMCSHIYKQYQLCFC